MRYEQLSGYSITCEVSGGWEQLIPTPVVRQENMSQAHHSGNESEETYHQHGETARLNAEFNFSLTDHELKAKLNAVGAAVGEGAKRLGSFTQTVVYMLAIFSVTVVALAVMSVRKARVESKQ